MTERSTSGVDKRRVILDAAVRVSATRGYHTSRVDAYFASKEEVLETSWRELRRCCCARGRDRPDLVTVMVREVARSPQLQSQVEEIRAGSLIIQRVIERGQEDGSFRPELDARLASWIFYGGLEELLTGWVLGQLPDGEAEVARAERTVIELLCGGIVRPGAQRQSGSPVRSSANAQTRPSTT